MDILPMMFLCVLSFIRFSQCQTVELQPGSLRRVCAQFIKRWWHGE